MKAVRQDPEFIPVELTLQTQHEVDAVFALLNHSDLSKTVNLTEAHKVLSPFVGDYRPLHTAICAMLETNYGPKPDMECETCLYERRNADKEPCHTCNSRSAWKPKTEKTCSTCLHSRKSVNHEPCKYCMGASMWEPKRTRTI